MILNSSQKEFADADRARLEAGLSGPDLSEMPDFQIHIPGHHRWKWFIPLFLVLVGIWLFFVLKVSL